MDKSAFGFYINLDALVPALDDAAHSQLELDGLGPVEAAVELGAVLQTDHFSLVSYVRLMLNFIKYIKKSDVISINLKEITYFYSDFTRFFLVLK